MQEVTFQRLVENGVEVDTETIKTTIIDDAIPEVVIVGSQPPAKGITLPGKLA